MRSIKFFTLLLFLLVSAGTAQAQDYADAIRASLSEGGVFTLRSQRGSGYVMTETAEHTLRGVKAVEGDAAQQWVIRRSGSGYTLRNVATGNYVQAKSELYTIYEVAPAASVFYIGVSVQADADHPFIGISTSSSLSGYTFLHDDGSHNVVNWGGPKENGDNSASNWELCKVNDADLNAISKRFQELDGYVKPEAGKVVRIRNYVSGMYMAERGEDNSLYCAWSNADDMAQHWLILSDDDGNLLLQNVKTLRYVGKSANYGLVSSTTSMPRVTFTPYETLWDCSYAITAGGIHLYNSGGNNVITGSIGDARSHWFFTESELSDDDIREAQGDYAIYADLTLHHDSYNTAFCSFFADASCSALLPEYDAMSDADFDAALQSAALPEYLRSIARKVKRNDWAPYEREFRVADYKIYSRFDAWNAVGNPERIGTGYCFGRLSNPTGIVAHGGDVLAIFCENDAPAGTSLQLETTQGTAYSGNTATLHRGLNVFTFSTDVICYIFYQLYSPEANLADYPAVRIHIEGGRLQGYFDLTRGHTNDDWAYMRDNLLKESSVVNLKTPHLVFAFDNNRVQAACPDNMEGVLGVWEDIINSEREILGVSNTYIPHVEERCNNIFNCFSGDSNYTGYMHATNYGGYFNDTTIPTIMNYEQMCSGGIWGPAHELGHLHQALFNLVGTTEASNNLYANVYVYQQGRTTERASSPQTVFDEFAAGTHWVDQNIWTMTKLFYQLYMYYMVQGNCPEFFPQLFVRLRQDGLDRRQNVLVNGTDEYLKFARICCDITGDDLSEFFEAYGFFRPIDNRYIRDYGDYYLSTTQRDIDETLDYMHQFSQRPMGNLLFLDDRIEPVLATYEGHAEGEFKTRRGDDQVGAGVSAGDYGQYTTYISPATAASYVASAPDYFYTLDADCHVTIHGEGATGLVGIKIYDADGRLAYLANTQEFTLPADLAAQTLRVVAAFGDGSDRELGLNAPLPDGVSAATLDAESDALRYSLDGRRATSTSASGIYISRFGAKSSRKVQIF